jgi:hypothetical protein
VLDGCAGQVGVACVWWPLGRALHPLRRPNTGERLSAAQAYHACVWIIAFYVGGVVHHVDEGGRVASSHFQGMRALIRCTFLWLYVARFRMHDHYGSIPTFLAVP